jgi:predicted AlkP superfamily phosphohydrolase/phosphomutase
MSGPAVVVGLDGIPWEFIEKWTDEGHLPNFAKLRTEGAAGPCTSTAPALTALAWPSIATGVRADKHGIYGFSKLASNYSTSITTSKDCQHTSMWDYLPSVVVNVPMTYPASEIDGLMVTGMMTPGESPRFTHPRSLRDRIEADHPDYKTGLDWNDYMGRSDDLVADVDDMLDKRTRLMVDLFDEDYELFFIVYTEPDRLQHLVWDESVLRTHYQRLDEMLGEAIDHVEATGGTLYVVSDHGFGPVDRVANLNTLLGEAGFLEPAGTTGLRGLLSRAGVTKDRTLAALDRVGISDKDIVRYLPDALVGSAAATIPGDHGLFDLNHSETQAFAYGMGNIFVNSTDRFDSGAVEPEDVPRIKQALTDFFESAEDPETGESPLTVADGDEEFPTDPNSPDLVVEAGENYSVSTGNLTESGFGDATKYQADHKPEGVFLAWGPDIAPGVTPTDTTVYDFAPTVLHGLGRPIPADTDGRVLTEIFRPDSPPGRTDVERFDYETGRVTAEDEEEGEDDFSDVEDRLKGLGYME